MARTEIPSEQVLDQSIRRDDLDIITPGQAVLAKVTKSGIGISKTHTGIDEGTGDVNFSLKADGFGMNKAYSTKEVDETVSGATFIEYHSLDFNVTDLAVNEFRVNADFYWGHNSASNDIRVQLFLDGVQIGKEMRAEPKDAGTDQMYQNNILVYLENISIGTHTLSLRYRPATASRVSRMYRAVLEAWRIA